MRVWPACRSFSAGRFDDLTISRSETILVQATDYGVWGDVLREQKTDEKVYRYGYQGQFAEKDEETGWNHFELREYDPIVGRWTSTDPYGQYWSPYVNVGNDPVSYVDPRGGSGGPARQMPQASSNLELATLAANGTTFFDPVEIISNRGSGLPPNFLDYILDYLPGERYNGTEILSSAGTNIQVDVKRVGGFTFNPFSRTLFHKEYSNTGNSSYSIRGDDKDVRIHQEFGFQAGFGLNWKRLVNTGEPMGFMDGHYKSDVKEITISYYGLTVKYKYGSEGRSVFYGGNLGAGAGIGVGIQAEAWHGNVIKF